MVADIIEFVPWKVIALARTQQLIIGADDTGWANSPENEHGDKRRPKSVKRESNMLTTLEEIKVILDGTQVNPSANSAAGLRTKLSSPN